jgi:hypothetical protein
VAGFAAVPRVYSPLGILFFGLIAALYYRVGTYVALPPRLGPSAAAAALAGVGAGIIAVTWLYLSDSRYPPSLAAWAGSLVLVIVSQGALGGILGASAAWMIRRRVRSSSSAQADA